ncbi:hypothetical protein [Mycobacteroides sp. PCS013]|uniref:hypothetical protein n=1 Tax=Mycobacteroides sp. PCS013 TaxID=3074106 RepID=UPI003C2F8037
MLDLGCGAVGGHLIAEHGFDLAARFMVKLDGAVVVSNLLLDLRYEHSFLLTVGDLLVPPQANEVGIDGAGRVLGIGDHEAAVAVSAEN